MSNLGVRCDQERMKRNQLEEQAMGWFSPDPEKMAVAKAYPMPACQRLEAMNIRKSR